MFSNTPFDFAPLYAEEYLVTDNSKRQQHLQVGNRYDIPRSPSRDGSADRPQRKVSTSPTSPVIQRQPLYSQGEALDPDIQSTTETSSDNFSPHHDTEAGFEDEIYVRKLSLSGSSRLLPVRSRISNTSSDTPTSHSPNRAIIDSPLGLLNKNESELRSSIDSMPQQQQQQQQQPSPEIVKKNKELRHLMEKLDSLQRKLVNLEVDYQCRGLEFAKHTELELILQQLGEGEKGPVGIKIKGTPPDSSRSTSTIGDEENNPGFSGQRTTTNPRVGSEAKSLIYRLLNDYEEMEHMYKEEKFKNVRHTTMDIVASSTFDSYDDGSPLDHSPFTLCFQPQLQDEVKYSPGRLEHNNFDPNANIWQRSTVAPDPPEIDLPQKHYVHPRFCAVRQDEHTLLDDGDDRRSDDLSSREVSCLIDEDVQSTCTAADDHNGEGRQYLRDAILGINDGIVSTFLLVAGVRGGGMPSADILLTAIAGSIAGAVSMCAGEYVATKSQNEVTSGEIATEKRHIRDYRRHELTQVSDLLELIGIGDTNRAIQKKLVRHYARDPEALLKLMIALELGFLEDEERSPFMAGFVSFFLFLIGAAPSVIPYLVPGIDPTVGFIAASVATCVMLLIVGAVKTWATKGNCLTAALENVFIAGFGGIVAYGAGVLAQHLIDN